MTMRVLEECPGCRVAPGQSHKDDCDHARCPDCGEQLFFHDCQEWPEDADGPNRDAIWHGIDPRAEVAHTQDWWTTAVGIDHPVEDFSRVSFAEALKQITWDPNGQRYVIGDIDEQRLDQAIASSR